MQDKPNNANRGYAESSLRYPGWRAVAACFVMALFCWGFGFYGQGIYLDVLQRQHDWGEGLVAGASTVYFLFSAVLVMFLGGVMERFGPRRVVLAGIVCLGLSTTLVGQVDSPWQLYLDYMLMAFGWAAMSIASISTIVGAWFERRRGLALSLAFAGASAAGFIATPALVALISRVGLDHALLYAVATMLVVLVPITLAWMRTPPSTLKPDTAATSATAAAGFRWTRGRALRDLGFWTLAAPSALALLAQVGFLVHQITYLQALVGQAGAALAVAVTTSMALIGRFTVGAVIDRFNPRRISAISYASQAAALFAMIWTAHPVVLLTTCAVFGFSVGNVLVFPALIMHREFPARAYPLLIAFATAIIQFVYALGPGVLGWLRQASGSYAAPLALCVALEIVATAVVLIPSRQRLDAAQSMLGEADS